jgi:hypothetical protein
MHFSSTANILLAPGFSPVLDWPAPTSRFNGFPANSKAAKAAGKTNNCRVTGLKPGANDKTGSADFESTH